VKKISLFSVPTSEHYLTVLRMMNLILIGVKGGDSSGKSMSWRPRRQQVVVAQLVCDEARVAMQEQMFFARRGGW